MLEKDPELVGLLSVEISQNDAYSNLHCETKAFKPVMFYKAACVTPASGFGSEGRLMQTSWSVMYQYVKSHSEDGHRPW